MECIGFDIRPWMCSRSHPGLFARELHLNTMVVEKCNIEAVARQPFAPDVLYTDYETVYSTRGIPFDVLFHAVPTEDDARACVVAVLRAMSQMHASGFVHLDAKLANIVMLPGRRADGCNVTLSTNKEMHVAFIDYETMFVPADRLRAEDVLRFDEVVRGMAVYGWKMHAEYTADVHRYRYDVHTFMVTLGRACVRDVHRRILPSVARALGHIPVGHVSRCGSDIGREYDEYLVDSSMPVASAADAIAIVVSEFLPAPLRHVKWSVAVCGCTATSYCRACTNVVDSALNTTCPYAYPDVVGAREGAVRASMIEGLRCSGGDAGVLHAALVRAGARHGDACRLVGVLDD